MPSEPGPASRGLCWNAATPPSGGVGGWPTLQGQVESTSRGPLRSLLDRFRDLGRRLGQALGCRETLRQVVVHGGKGFLAVLGWCG